MIRHHKEQEFLEIIKMHTILRIIILIADYLIKNKYKVVSNFFLKKKISLIKQIILN